MEIDNQTMTNQATESHNTNSVSFGHKLKQARVSQGLSLEDASSKLFILRRHLEAIEAEDFSELPQIAFARGFVVNYSKLLGLDPEQMVDSFNKSYPEELKKKSVYDIESPLKPMGTLQREGRRSWRINPLLILGIIGLIVLAVFLLRTVSNARDTSQVDAGSADLVTDLSDSEQLAGAAIDTPVVNSAVSNGTINNNGSAVDIANTGSAVGTTAEVVQDVDTTNTSKLAFWIKSETVVSVTDATGNSLISGTKPRGGYTVEGVPPLTIRVSDVSKVNLDVDNQPINLQDFAENNRADFTLPQ